MQIDGAGIGGADEFAMCFIERINQMNETPGLVPVFRPEFWYAIHDHGIEMLCQHQIISRSQCLCAEIFEGNEGDVAGRTGNLKFAPLNFQRYRLALFRVGQVEKGSLQLLRGFRA